MTIAEQAARGSDAAIGIFDSGIGGLSVLRHVRECLPRERLLYFADSGFAPYGGKPEEVIVARSFAIADFLLQSGSKALVVACNTATAAAIKALRERYPALPVVGVEPGLKPAAAMTSTRVVGVLATERTLASSKFALLCEAVSATTGVRFIAQPCTGLADQIEKGELHSRATATLVRGYVEPLLEQGADTLVLGCTHYPFAEPAIRGVVQRITSRPVGIVDTGAPVARQLARLLAEHRLLAPPDSDGAVSGVTTGSCTSLADAFSKLLMLHPDVSRLAAAARTDCQGGPDFV